MDFTGCGLMVMRKFQFPALYYYVNSNIPLGATLLKQFEYELVLYVTYLTILSMLVTDIHILVP